MSNRKKPKNKRLIFRKALEDQGLVEVKPPEGEKQVLKEVPAVVKWADVPGIDREDEEVTGKCIIYEDKTTDIITFDDVSEDAKLLIEHGVMYFANRQN